MCKLSVKRASKPAGSLCAYANIIQVTTTCVCCGATHVFNLDTNKYRRWKAGEHIQDVWPEMPVDEREMLMSGTCPKCFDALFDFDDEE